MSNPSNEWQDISSAPKDGTVVLLYQFDDVDAANGDDPHVYDTAYFHKGYWRSTNGGVLDLWEKVTHWKPVGPPPDQPVEAAKDSVCRNCGGNGFPMEFIPGRLGMRRSSKPCYKCGGTGQPKDPAAQTPEAEFAENMGAIADTLASANVPDRTEGEGPYFAGAAIRLPNRGNPDLPHTWYHHIVKDDEVEVLNAAHAEGQASTQQNRDAAYARAYNDGHFHGRDTANSELQRLLRIEVAAKETARVWTQPTTRAQLVEKIDNLVALLDDEGDGAK